MLIHFSLDLVKITKVLRMTELQLQLILNGGE
jgi:hypothetical protein